MATWATLPRVEGIQRKRNFRAQIVVANSVASAVGRTDGGAYVVVAVVAAVVVFT